MRINNARISTVAALLAVLLAAATSPTTTHAFSLPSTATSTSRSANTLSAVKLETDDKGNIKSAQNSRDLPNKYWEIAPSLYHPQPRALTPELLQALETDSHPIEAQNQLGRGISITSDWREAWTTYGDSEPSDCDESSKNRSSYLIDNETGYAQYDMHVEGRLPDDLVGVLYRNGPGKFGVGGERVQHTLDADALVYKISFPPLVKDQQRRVEFTSRFVQTQQFQDEQQAGRFLYRGTFGTTPTASFVDARLPHDGLDRDPVEASALARFLGSAGNVNIKNSANTHIVSFGGKLLTLFEAGLPHALDPQTLETLGEETLGGVLQEGLPVKLGLEGIPEPDFIGGTAHTAHPNICPRTGNLVGWHWSMLIVQNCVQLTFTEWSADGFQPIQSTTFPVPGCELAPHDMAITNNYVVMNMNALTMNQLPFLLGLQGPAASLSMDGRAPVQTWIFPRPTSANQFEPFSVEIPPCFTIHHSHAYEDSYTGNIVTYFTGWPPSDSTDFLGAWGGYAPEFPRIPATFLWRLEIDPVAQQCVSMDIAPNSANACVEHVLVHPNFSTTKAEYVYGTVSNLVGDSTPPNGYARLRVEQGGSSGEKKSLSEGEFNDKIEAYWFGSRYFTTEPIIVPKEGGDPNIEDQAYLLGIVRDAAAKKNFLAIFDLEQDLSVGPVCKVWLKSGVPHGIHGCFAQDDKGGPSVFC